LRSFLLVHLLSLAPCRLVYTNSTDLWLMYRLVHSCTS